MELLHKIYAGRILTAGNSESPQRDVTGHEGVDASAKIDNMDRTYLFCAIFAFTLFLIVATSYAQQPDETKGQAECVPIYGVSPSEIPYGAPRKVKTPREALEILQKIISIHHSGIRVGKIREGVYFYMAEIVNTKGRVVDVIIIDKRSSRIRTTY